jgi:hypothetical protein
LVRGTGSTNASDGNVKTVGKKTILILEMRYSVTRPEKTLGAEVIPSKGHNVLVARTPIETVMT